MAKGAKDLCGRTRGLTRLSFTAGARVRATETLLDLMKNSKVDSVRLRAAEIIFDRVHGEAVQRMAGENHGEPITVIIDPRLAPIVRTGR